MAVASPHELVADVSELVTLPDISIRVNDMVNQGECSAAEIGATISQDPALTVNVLHVANSALFGFASHIDTVSRAVAVLGNDEVRNIVVGTATIDAFKGVQNDLVSMENFWYHSVCCALAAQFLASESHGKNEGMFVAGLLHDIGQLVMFNRMPEQARQALELSIEDRVSMDIPTAERHVFGFDHTQVGAELCRSWNLPPRLCECIEYHHRPRDAEHFAQATAIVHVANSVAVLAELRSTTLREAPLIDPVAWELTGLKENIVPQAVGSVYDQIDDIKSVFGLERLH